MSTWLTYGLLGGGAALGVGAGLTVWWAADRMKKTKAGVQEAVVSGGTVKIRTTGYWPYVKGLTAKERKMEGGIEGAAVWRGKRAIDPYTGKRPIIHTLEMHLQNPAAHPYVSLSGDPDVWPWGQRIVISAWPSAVFRFVDTGSHFTGLKKTYRVSGQEPVDVAVNDSKTFVPKKNVTAQIVKGDNWAGGVGISTTQLRDQVVTGDVCVEVIGADYAALARQINPADRRALARAIESARPRGNLAEKQAVAWAVRNRAKRTGRPVVRVLMGSASDDDFGPRGAGGRDYLSTALAAGAESDAVAACVLSLPDEADPTLGAVDFWIPSQQAQLRRFAEARRAAAEAADEATAEALAGFDGCVGEDEVRATLRQVGLVPCGAVGDVELLAEG